MLKLESESYGDKNREVNRQNTSTIASQCSTPIHMRVKQIQEQKKELISKLKTKALQDKFMKDPMSINPTFKPNINESQESF